MKAKTHSGSQKRVKITGTGKFRTAKIGKRHLLQNKSAKAKGKNKYGAETSVANERKMKWGMQVSGLKTPKAKKDAMALSGLTPKEFKAANPRKFPTIKTAAIKQVKIAPKTVATKKITTPKAAKKVVAAKKPTPAKKSTTKKTPAKKTKK
ncbi:MAG: bL35 family ribosomal protein [Candidatus Gracilibacteria bacterium]|jgi:large subunit ribosomal protein L35